MLHEIYLARHTGPELTEKMERLFRTDVVVQLGTFIRRYCLSAKRARRHPDDQPGIPCSHRPYLGMQWNTIDDWYGKRGIVRPSTMFTALRSVRSR